MFYFYFNPLKFLLVASSLKLRDAIIQKRHFFHQQSISATNLNCSVLVLSRFCSVPKIWKCFFFLRIFFFRNRIICKRVSGLDSVILVAYFNRVNHCDAMVSVSSIVIAERNLRLICCCFTPSLQKKRCFAFAARKRCG